MREAMEDVRTIAGQVEAAKLSRGVLKAIVAKSPEAAGKLRRSWCAVMRAHVEPGNRQAGRLKESADPRLVAVRFSRAGRRGCCANATSSQTPL